MARRRPERPAARVFDEDYYRRHYEDPATRVATEESVQRLADFVCAYARMMDVDLERALDLGCGLGLWRDALTRNVPDIEYTGVEISAHLCERLGWEHGSVVDYRADEPHDLVVCQGVLQYLGKKDAKKALRNLARLTGSLLYLEVLTQNDWDEKVSQEITDGDVFLRDADFYLERLDRHFVRCGGGVFLKRDAGVVLFDLEHLDPGAERA